MEGGLILAEQNLLAYAIQNPATLKTLHTSLFSSKTAKGVLHAIKELHASGVKCDTEHLMIELSAAAISVAESTLQNITTKQVLDVDLTFLKSALSRALKQQTLQKELLPQLIEEISSKNGTDFTNIRGIQKKIEAITAEEDDSTLTIVGDNIGDYYEERLNERQSGNSFYSTGDSYLDRTVTLGFAPGTMTTLFGTTGSGKTSFALSLFLKQIHKQIPTLYISLEMPADMLIDKIFANKYKIPVNSLYPHMSDENTIPEWVFNELKSFREEMKTSNYFKIVDRSSLSIDGLESIIIETKEEMGVDYLNVIVDLTSMLEDFNDVGRNTHAFAILCCMNRLNTIVKKLGIHMLNLVQSNRDQDNIKLNNISDIDKLWPSLNNIRDGNTIAERSRLVLAVFRPKYYADRYFPDSPENLILEDCLYLCNLKQSHGVTQRLKYLFIGATSSVYRYESVEKEENKDASLTPENPGSDSTVGAGESTPEGRTSSVRPRRAVASPGPDDGEI